MGEFTLKQWSGKTFRVDEGSSYTNNVGVRQVVVQVMTENGWRDFSRLPESELNEMRGISQASDNLAADYSEIDYSDMCLKCEAVERTWDRGNPDYCDDCSDAEQEPKVVMTLFKGKVKDLATADLSGGWRGPGHYEMRVDGLSLVVRFNSLCDLVEVMSENPGTVVRFIGGKL